MMAGLFLLLCLAFLATLKGSKSLAINLIFATLALALVMFYAHATDILKINW